MIYSVNLRNAALTRYTNFDFIRIIRHEGKYYGLRQDGLYLLEGETDDNSPIEAFFKTGQMNAGIAQKKSIHALYLRENQVSVSATLCFDNEITYPSHTYLSAFNGQRVKTGKGMNGIFFDITISNVDGSLFRVGFIECLIAPKSRRI